MNFHFRVSLKQFCAGFLFLFIEVKGKRPSFDTVGGSLQMQLSLCLSPRPVLSPSPLVFQGSASAPWYDLCLHLRWEQHPTFPALPRVCTGAHLLTQQPLLLLFLFCLSVCFCLVPFGLGPKSKTVFCCQPLASMDSTLL